MNLRPQKSRLAAFALGLAVWFAALVVTPPSAQAMFHRKPQTQRKLNVIQRHPTMTGIAAGAATRAALRASAARKKARGQKLTWAERHSLMSGVAAGVVTRHMIKKHTPK